MNTLLCFLVTCIPLADIKDGAMFCSLGADKVSSYEDTCSFTCNTGYELTGSDTRTCQKDGSWSGTQTMCRKSECFVLLHSKFVFITEVGSSL